MTRLERDLQGLFTADARARTIQRIDIARRPSRVPFAAVVFGVSAAVLAIVAVLTIADERSGRPASPPAVPPASPSPSPSLEACLDPLRRQPGEPVVGGSKLAGGGALEIRVVRVPGPEARWIVIFAVGEGGSVLDIAPRATLRGPDGPVAVLSYEAGPDEEHTTPTTADLRVLPCSSAVLIVRSAPIRSGEHTLTLESVTAAGRSTAVPVFAPLTCAPAGAGGQECVNTRGTRATPLPSPSRAP